MGTLWRSFPVRGKYARLLGSEERQRHGFALHRTALRCTVTREVKDDHEPTNHRGR